MLSSDDHDNVIQNDKEKMISIKNKLMDILEDYIKVSSIAGVAYLTKQKLSIERIFWFFSLFLLLLLAVYGSYKSYFDWKASPVIATSSSISIPVQSFPFPKVVFCNEGRVIEPFGAAFFRLVVKKLVELNVSFDHVSPFIMYGQKTNFYSSIEDTMAYLFPELKSYIKINNFQYLDPSEYKYVWDIALERAYKLLPLWAKIIPRIGPLPLELLGYYPENWFLYNLILFSYKDIKSYFKLRSYFEVNANGAQMNFGEGFHGYFESNLNLTMGDYENFGYNIEKLSMKDMLGVVLPLLWYSNLPCFDIIDLTADETSKRTAFLKNCKWNGKSLPCSAVFTSVPTDAGMCCAFNVGTAEDIFISSKFAEIVLSLQKQDKVHALENSTTVDWFLKQKEPTSRHGRKMGLYVTLDAHTNLNDQFSKSSDFDSFTFLILPSNDFPLVKNRGKSLRRGYHSYITMFGTSMTADGSLREVSPALRECLFKDEFHLKLFKSYSQANCLFECFLKIAKEQTMKNSGLNETCTPWYFPSANGDDFLCMPHDQKKLEEVFGKNLNPFDCTECLPDCNTEIYDYRLTHEPIRECDDFNFRCTPLCNPGSRSQDVSPFLWWNYFNDSFEEINYEPTYYPFALSDINTKFRQPNREHFSGLSAYFENTANIYNAYKRDIATVSVYFEYATVWGFSLQPSSNWGIQFANFGGLFGLTISLTICSLVELLYLLLRMICFSNILLK